MLKSWGFPFKISSLFRRRIAHSQVPIQLVFASENLPHPSKAQTGGEDAAFFDKGTLAFGVSDGVGGWADVGIDSSAYSNALINNLRSTSALALVQSDATSTSRDSELLAKKILETAWLATHAPGSATALFAFVSAAHHRLTTCNMGDSGCIVLRPTPAAAAYSVVFRTQEQQHYFNCPYQLSSPETRVKFPGTLHDHPRLARASHFTLCPNDIIVAATDGVFDNLFDSNITELAALHCPPSALPSSTESGQRAQQLAHALVQAAQDVGDNSEARCPFVVHAAAAGIQTHGGKLDDSTAVVALVLPIQTQSKL